MAPNICATAPCPSKYVPIKFWMLEAASAAIASPGHPAKASAKLAISRAHRTCRPVTSSPPASPANIYGCAASERARFRTGEAASEHSPSTKEATENKYSCGMATPTGMHGNAATIWRVCASSAAASADVGPWRLIDRRRASQAEQTEGEGVVRSVWKARWMRGRRKEVTSRVAAVAAAPEKMAEHRCSQQRGTASCTPMRACRNSGHSTGICACTLSHSVTDPDVSAAHFCQLTDLLCPATQRTHS
jgi:hypothetical protein